MGDRVSCGQFMNCVNGRGFTFDCPEGLAFSQETYRCEWPDQVSDCDAEAFVGFTCPAEAQTDTVTHYNFYRSEQDCQVYYICLEGRPRMYRCTEGKLFDSLTNTCEAAENVTTCGSASYRVAPKQAPVQYTQPRQVPTAAPAVVKQAAQFSQFGTTQPKTQFGGFSSSFQQPAARQQQQQVFAQPKSFNSFAAPSVTQSPFQVKVTEDPYAFIQPRLGSGVEAPRVSHNQQSRRTTQPESVLPQTRTQIGGNQGSFNFQSTGRGAARYQGK